MDQEADLLLDRVLRPNSALNPRILLAILLVVGAINLAFALHFVLHGAWPIAPFMGADVALLAWAFRASWLAAQRAERVTLTRSRLVVARTPGGETVLNPYWVRVELEPPTDRLALWSHGKAVRLGAFLPPAERLSLAEALRRALWQARQR
jgi:uncharacterized membrane protein